MKLADEQRKTRADPVSQRTAATKVLAALWVEKSSIEGQRKVTEADLGPVKYLAMLLGTDSDTALRRFVLVVALLLAPSAVLIARHVVGATVDLRAAAPSNSCVRT
jgi:hypothetical protein